MTIKIPPEAMGSHMEKQVQMLLQAVVLEADKRVKLGSPVDTGRFRSNWQIGENDTSGPEDLPDKQYWDQENPGEDAVQSNLPPVGTNYKPDGGEKVGNIYNIHNNLPYAERLGYEGWSAQNPGPWIDLIAKELEDWVKRSYEQIKAKT